MNGHVTRLNAEPENGLCNRDTIQVLLNRFIHHKTSYKKNDFPAGQGLAFSGRLLAYFTEVPAPVGAGHR